MHLRRGLIRIDVRIVHTALKYSQNCEKIHLEGWQAWPNSKSKSLNGRKESDKFEICLGGNICSTSFLQFKI